MTKRNKMELRDKLDAVINHPLMSDVEACQFVCYGDGMFTYEMKSLIDNFYEINFIPLDASTCVLDSEAIHELLSIPCGYIQVTIFDGNRQNGEVLLLHKPKSAFDFNLN